MPHYRSLLFLLVAAAVATAEASPSVDPQLETAFQAEPASRQAVVITYPEAPDQADIAALELIGLGGGYVLEELPMVLTMANRTQLARLETLPDVVSLYANRVYRPLTNASREFIGQAALLRDGEVTAANGGLPVTGKGVGVAIIDTGLDATHGDLALGDNVAQNVYFAFGDLDPVLCFTLEEALGSCPDLPKEFAGPVYFEDQPMTDVEGGHGTFVSGVIGATGFHSGNFYGGVAPGADLVGLVAGNDVGLTTFTILQAYDWILVNQFRYNIRVANNSFGSDLGDRSNYDPFDPINVGTRMMHDRFITVVYAAGNSGDVPGAINRLAVAPWVVSVAAGQKEGLGSPAGFSSRGWDNGSGVESAGHPADPLQPPNLRPDITAPGANIKATRSKGPGLTNLLGTALLQDQDIPPAFLPFYTTSQGTSFAAPHVAGVAALMLEANPALTPQQIMQILRDTAMPMPFEERVVGAGYVDAHNAVRKALGLARTAPPADLMPGPDTPAIVDARNDQIGTGAQDILSARFDYDASTDRIVYRLEMAETVEPTPNNRWRQSSVFRGTTVFVTTNVTETLETVHEYGTVAPDPNTGINTQTTLGSADAGMLDGHAIVVELGLDRINPAVGYDVRGTESTSTEAISQLLIGSSVTGGLLLTADSATGRNYTVAGEADDNAGDGDTGSGAEPAASCGGPGIHERFAGVVQPAGPVQAVTVDSACELFAAHLTYHPGNAGLTLALYDAAGKLVQQAQDGNGRRLTISGMPAGDYVLRVEGSPVSATDFVVQVRQRD
jgi:subtilisin family serine protease